MAKRHIKAAGLICGWLVIALAYIHAAVQQKDRLNLSAAAGGQMPYLRYAQGMAEEGIFTHWGDRNRMPLYPALLSFVYHRDWDTFVERSAWFAIASSVVILVVIGAAVYVALPTWPATALTLSAVVCVFPAKASFVQAELLYYGLLFLAWLILCRVIRCPHWPWAAAGGVVLGLAFLTKASALPVILAFVVAMGIRLLLARKNAVRTALATAVAFVSFIAVIYPYVANNKERFGQYFYNVNSTFFMWCDSWAQAKAFADRYDIEQKYPSATSDQIPGPVNYWQNHTPGQMLARLGYGFRTLGSLAIKASYGRYFFLALAGCAVMVLLGKRRAGPMPPPDRAIAVFCLLLAGGYLLVYAWYTLVAYGDRFLLSLFLPAMCAVLWLIGRYGKPIRPIHLGGQSIKWPDAVTIALSVALAVHGLIVLTARPQAASRTFIGFYFNESRELQRAGFLDEAAKGYAGVIRLDPGHAMAHHELGMIALQAGRFDDAIGELSAAVQLRPGDANMHNSLGSALIQAGRTEDAIAAFRRATTLKPDFAMAWYNLGGAYAVTGDLHKARAAHQQLIRLDPALAGQLATLLEKNRDGS